MSSQTPIPLTFAELGLDPRLLQEVEALGYTEPTPIQATAIPLVLAGKDLLGQAATGTGKTAAFSLPMLQRLAQTPRKDARPRALILVPTRELAVQVHKTMQRYAACLGLRIIEIYGGAPFSRQIRALDFGVDVVVATPGRAIDLQERGNLKLDAIEIAVLDEADEMLNMGFAEDIETLLGACGEPRQTLLFSATFPPRLRHIAGRHLKDPERVDVTRGPSATPTAATVEHVAYIVPRMQKIQALGRILEWAQPSGALVFCRSRDDVDDLCEKLSSKGIRAEALHGGLSQDQRDRVMNRFRRGACELLVATDVAARGLDVDQLSHVINYDLPVNGEIYVHRSGRTGRAGREGWAITLLEPMQQRMVRSIERMVGKPVQIAKIPSVTELRAKRLQTTVAEIRDLLAEPGAGDVESAVAELLSQADPVALLSAAFRLAHQAKGRDAERFADPSPSTVTYRPQPGEVRNAFTPPPQGEVRNAFTPPPQGEVRNAFTPPPQGEVRNAFTPPPASEARHAITPAPRSTASPEVLPTRVAVLAEPAAQPSLTNPTPAAVVAAGEDLSPAAVAKQAKKAARQATRAAARAAAAAQNGGVEVDDGEDDVASESGSLPTPTVNADDVAELRRERRVLPRLSPPIEPSAPSTFRRADVPPVRSSRALADAPRTGAGFEPRGPMRFGKASESRPAVAEGFAGGALTPRRKVIRPETTHLHFDVGAVAGVKPADLVGAIANETGLDSRSIGTIRIEDRASWVEIPTVVADTLVDALRTTSIRGTRARVRRVT